VRTEDHRAVQALRRAGAEYPTAWTMYDDFRANRESLGNWPDYVFAPLAAAHAIVSGGAPLEPAERATAARLGALAAWRPTQGIYRFAPSLRDALWATTVDGELAVDLLHRLPEWCVYLELDRDVDGRRLHGAWVHLERDPVSRLEELRLLLDFEQRLIAVPLLLADTLEQSMIALCASGVVGMRPDAHDGRVHPRLLDDDDVQDDERVQSVIEPIVSIVLYLCAANAELRSTTGERTPQRPKPHRRPTGDLHWEAAPHPTLWEVGALLGAALEHAGDGVDAGAPSPQPAQWHSYWVDGPGAVGGHRELWWLPPRVTDDGADGESGPVRVGR